MRRVVPWLGTVQAVGEAEFTVIVDMARVCAETALFKITTLVNICNYCDVAVSGGCWKCFRDGPRSGDAVHLPLVALKSSELSFFNILYGFTDHDVPLVSGC